MNPKSVGERTEGLILARLLQQGYSVSMPFGDNQRYDFIVDDCGKLYRCQCKTGRLKNGSVRFNVCSTNWNQKTRRSYHGQIELFLVYCPQIEKFYKVPIEECGSVEMTLRVEPSSQKGRLASVFEF